MSSRARKLFRLRHSLAFRLTLWYAGIFTISSCVAFLLFYLLITSVIRERTDQELSNRVGEFSTLLAVQGIDAVKRVAILEAQASGVKKIFFRLLKLNGEVFSSSNMSYWRDIGVERNAIRELVRVQEPVFDTIVISDRKDKVRILYGLIGPGIVLQLGQSMENQTRFIEAFKKIGKPIKNTSKIVIHFDHAYPAPNLISAENQRKIVSFIKEHSIKNFFHKTNPIVKMNLKNTSLCLLTE